jgi:3-oxoacyl-[acyl-carrier-protein] synthase II
VVVTGLGVITSLGVNVDSFWDSLLKGRSGIKAIESFDTSPFTCRIGGEIVDFNPDEYLDHKDVKRNDRFVHFAVAAAHRAMDDAKLSLGEDEKPRAGVMIGSGIGGMTTIEVQAGKFHQLGHNKVSPFMIPSLICNMASGVVAIELGFMGPNLSVVTACASGANSIGEAYNIMKLGKADVMVAGGSEAALNALGFAGFCSMKAMSSGFNDNPTGASRPFDAKRDGFVMGEGAGMLVLETLDHAKNRGAKIYCELAGYHCSSDAFHVTAPHPAGAGLAECLEVVMREAAVSKKDIDYINAHGTSTKYNDKYETVALKSVFGDRANNIPISSTKSMTGHLLGATGGVEAIVCVKAIQTGRIPPTINYEFPDPECDLNYVPNKALSKEINVAISENSGFGGQNVALLFKKLSS